ncbi:MAG: hypothetical protein IKQ90_00550 [Ruminococcus sp.]|nr:hypothetical protein [Ruminococcus sp.]
MNFHRRHLREDYNAQLEQLVDEIKRQRALNGEDVNAPINITKEQLRALKAENRGLNDMPSPNSETKQEKSWLGLIMFVAAIAMFILTGQTQKFGFFMFGLGILLLMFTFADRTKNVNGTIREVTTARRIPFWIASGASFAIGAAMLLKDIIK